MIVTTIDVSLDLISLKSKDTRKDEKIIRREYIRIGTKDISRGLIPANISYSI